MRTAEPQAVALGSKPAGTWKNARTAEEIAEWLVSHIAEQVEVEATEIDVRKAFTYYGLDSAEAVILTGDLEGWLGRPLPATLALDYPNIESLARYLAGEASVTEVNAGNDLDRLPEGEEVDRLLTEIERLSEDETQSALALERQLKPKSYSHE